ncbi:hypothetical protein P7K49_012079 [Saguinus oedipus]|uniref:Uncharacterized protein n=1 Tax=Saguinus oedipus TaxID=9490 RepID=A0ABQ9VSR6_SAGOE|nr:hypothetical protein P7K49_012079 [Saguinus oedipus]
MPDSPKIWGTRELEKQGYLVAEAPPSLPACNRPDPRETRSRRSAQEWCPTEPRTQLPGEISPSIHHINSDSTNAIPPRPVKGEPGQGMASLTGPSGQPCQGQCCGGMPALPLLGAQVYI